MLKQLVLEIEAWVSAHRIEIDAVVKPAEGIKQLVGHWLGVDAAIADEHSAIEGCHPSPCQHSEGQLLNGIPMPKGCVLAPQFRRQGIGGSIGGFSWQQRQSPHRVEKAGSGLQQPGFRCNWRDSIAEDGFKAKSISRPAGQGLR